MALTLTEDGPGPICCCCPALDAMSHVLFPLSAKQTGEKRKLITTRRLIYLVKCVFAITMLKTRRKSNQISREKDQGAWHFVRINAILDRSYVLFFFYFNNSIFQGPIITENHIQYGGWWQHFCWLLQQFKMSVAAILDYKCNLLWLAPGTFLCKFKVIKSKSHKRKIKIKY